MNLIEFKAAAEARDPRHINRSTDACDWFFNEIDLFHERAHIPWARSTKPMTVHYWSETTYGDLNKATEDAKSFGGIVQQGWYCEEPNLHWFLIFNDLDKALEHAFFCLKKERPELGLD